MWMKQLQTVSVVQEERMVAASGRCRERRDKQMCGGCLLEAKKGGVLPTRGEEDRGIGQVPGSRRALQRGSLRDTDQLQEENPEAPSEQ